MGNGKNDPKPVEVPDDEFFYERPFFAYGHFKKGQLAYCKIADCVEDVAHDEVPFKMHIRDGVPTIKKENSRFRTRGHKIYFANGREEEAYSIISNTELGNYYKWDTVDIGGETFNFLTTEDLEGTFVDIDDDGKYIGEYDGRNDPFFFKAPQFIRNELENIDYDDECFIFRIQMYYMLLWSAIDRYCTLKYDISKSQGDYLKALSQDEAFLSALYSIKPEERGAVRSARNERPLYFNLRRPNFILNFYYTIRSNVVHRGKERGNNMDGLIMSLNDMLDIFDKLIENTFGSDE